MAATLLFIYFVLALTLWLLPLPFFKKNTLDDFNRLRPVTRDNPYRGLLVSILPMIFYSIVMIVVQAKRSFIWWQAVLTAVTIAAGIYFMWWVMEKSRWKIGRVQALLGANWALVFVLVWMGKSAGSRFFWNYYFVGLGMLIQMGLLGGLIKQLEARLTTGANRAHRRYYRLVFFVMVIGTLAISLVNNLNVLSPTFVLLVIITAYVLLNDLVIALYVLKQGRRLKYGLTLLLVLFGWFIFVRKSGIHNINYVRSELRAKDDRVDFHTYFEAWYRTNLEPAIVPGDSTEIPVFLLAAQGGGSRAGLWTADILNRLETESDYRFHRHLFAITSASGGSAGTGATLALWRFMLDNEATIDPDTRRFLGENFAAEMFRRNYLSAQFMQLFVNEVGKRFVSLVRKDVYDRNLEHQRHEALGFANAVRFGLEKGNGLDSPFDRLDQTFAQGDADSLKVGKGRRQIPNYPMWPYLDFWYAGPKKPDPRLPLFFPITANIQTGKAGYPSPVAWDSTLFLDAIDVLCDAEKSRPGYSLALETGVNLSQIFPVMNAYTYIEGTGNFMDGGLFDNLGLSLMTRLRERLQTEIAGASFIPDAVKKRLKVKLLFAINDTSEPFGEATFNAKNQSTATFTALTFSSIQGTTTWWLDYFRRSLPPDEQPITLVLQGPGTPERDKVPLGRWLSNRSVDSVCARVRRLDTQRILHSVR